MHLYVASSIDRVFMMQADALDLLICHSCLDIENFRSDAISLLRIRQRDDHSALTDEQPAWCIVASATTRTYP